LRQVPFKLFQSSVSGSGIYQQFQALEKFDSRLVQEGGVALCVGFLACDISVFVPGINVF